MDLTCKRCHDNPVVTCNIASGGPLFYSEALSKQCWCIYSENQDGPSPKLAQISLEHQIIYVPCIAYLHMFTMFERFCGKGVENIHGAFLESDSITVDHTIFCIQRALYEGAI